jgi:hypothetical protein
VKLGRTDEQPLSARPQTARYSLLVELVGARASQNSTATRASEAGAATHSSMPVFAAAATATRCACSRLPCSRTTVHMRAGASASLRCWRCAALSAAGVVAAANGPLFRDVPSTAGQPPPEAHICDTGKG